MLPARPCATFGTAPPTAASATPTSGRPSRRCPFAPSASTTPYGGKGGVGPGETDPESVAEILRAVLARPGGGAACRRPSARTSPSPAAAPAGPHRPGPPCRPRRRPRHPRAGRALPAGGRSGHLPAGAARSEARLRGRALALRFTRGRPPFSRLQLRCRSLLLRHRTPVGRPRRAARPAPDSPARGPAVLVDPLPRP